ncbi:UNKNOWN [Stylonychia lemnae]|uniref:Transmembrane protein n=1 Tax=Stylonychia lemnae TaxID=5949 RepID=A0A078A0F8_STYLE|nr:UNKNOWN [Stylonychia lemnae]|eukprot:CDW75327.1 UNKNOWN [Stylonychia lemnae]
MGFSHVIYYVTFLLASKEDFYNSFFLYQMVIMILQPGTDDKDLQRQEFVNFMVMTICQFILYSVKGYYGICAWKSLFKRKVYEDYYMISFTTYLYMITFSILVGFTKFNWVIITLIAIADIVQLLTHLLIRRFLNDLDKIKQMQDYAFKDFQIETTIAANSQSRKHSLSSNFTPNQTLRLISQSISRKEKPLQNSVNDFKSQLQEISEDKED